MSAPKKPRSIVAAFHKDSGGRLRLFSLTVLGEKREGHLSFMPRTEYDVEWSRKYGYLFDQCGFGGKDSVTVRGIYFVGGDVKIKEEPCDLVSVTDNPPWRSKATKKIRQRNRTRRLRSLPKAFDIEPGHDLLDWLEQNAIQQNAVYCSECKDFVPGEELCRHCWWCDKRGWYSSPTEPCKCTDTFECRGLKAA